MFFYKLNQLNSEEIKYSVKFTIFQKTGSTLHISIWMQLSTQLTKSLEFEADFRDLSGWLYKWLNW